MTEHPRICKQCGREFTTDNQIRTHCLTCHPYGRKSSSTAPTYTPEQHKWFEERSRRNMARFFIDELLGIREGRRVPKKIVYVLKQNDLVVSNRKGPGTPYVLTQIGERLLMEAI